MNIAYQRAHRVNFSDEFSVQKTDYDVSIGIIFGNDPYMANDTHSKTIGYLVWIFGFLGAHRFYYGKQISGAIWFCTLGLLGIGWLLDFFLIPFMDREADQKYAAGPLNYSVAWLLLTFLGVFGLHRFYMGKLLTGFLYLITVGLLGIGVFYDFWTLNGQVDELNRRKGQLHKSHRVQTL